ncbi:unnamed protein product [Arctia plantaginis]|uniref:Non-canonical purine NTP phosphatase/PRRC1 domain-containing protein n=1 Tax=Arctia plantaginis TaxID=874455 RepID=A0A8S0ZH19_ARCPL|nr:unnamed protein product [Arctia plantaginis]
MSNPEKKTKIPQPPMPTASTGNLLSSVAPPSQLPNFVTASPVVVAPAVTEASAVAPHPVPIPVAVPVQPIIVQSRDEPTAAQADNSEKFSPAIPLSKGEPTVSIRSPEDSQTTQSPDSLPDSSPEMDKIGDIIPGSGLFTWMKGAVATGGILHRVAEKAKSSVDSVITTLDPQMKEYLKSGGDLLLVVASDKEVKISPIRQAFQTVFGKANVVGYAAQSDVTATQPVGYAAAYAAAKQRIAHVRSVHGDLNNNVPVIAVEGFLHESVTDRWYDMSLIILSHPSLGIELQLQSQGTPVPSAAVEVARSATPADYAHAHTGFSVTIGSIMGDSLQVPHTQWQEASTGVSRRELLLLACLSIAGSYRRMLAISAAES